MPPPVILTPRGVRNGVGSRTHRDACPQVSGAFPTQALGTWREGRVAPGQAASTAGLQGPGQTGSPRYQDGPSALAGHPLPYLGSTAAW